MSYQFTISDMGLRLIKAYEGFYPKPRDLITGERAIGHGHRVISDDLDDISPDAADQMLKNDLEHVEAFINTHVHTALSQSQFDALCSLVFSIGEEAFLTSDVYHALNQGQIIEAANGFDVWRLSEIAGETYVVDALVRRRTAEKALFLRPTHRMVRAPRLQLSTQADPDIQPESYSSWTPSRVRAQVAEQATLTEDQLEQDAAGRMAEGTLALEDEPSPIAEAAAEVSERLDALMDRPTEDPADDLPDTLIQGDDDGDNVLEFKAASELVEGVDYNVAAETEQEAGTQGLMPYVTMTLVGLVSAVIGVWLAMRGSSQFLGDWGPLVTFAAVFIGFLLLIAGLYYLIKNGLRGVRDD